MAEWPLDCSPASVKLAELEGIKKPPFPSDVRVVAGEENRFLICRQAALNKGALMVSLEATRWVERLDQGLGLLAGRQHVRQSSAGWELCDPGSSNRQT